MVDGAACFVLLSNNRNIKKIDPNAKSTSPLSSKKSVFTEFLSDIRKSLIDGSFVGSFISESESNEKSPPSAPPRHPTIH